MILPDANVLIYAHRPANPEHEAYREWLLALTSGDEPFALSELLLQGVVRMVTFAGLFKPPSPPEVALAFCEELLAQPNAVRIRPGPRHWDIFASLCRDTSARGKLVADAYHAALAIEHGCDLATTDADFARFPGLRWHHPLRPRKPLG